MAQGPLLSAAFMIMQEHPAFTAASLVVSAFNASAAGANSAGILAGPAAEWDTVNGNSLRVFFFRSKLSRGTPAGNAVNACRPPPWRAGLPGGAGFRRFYAGYAASLLGTGMSSVALVFAVLDAGASPAGLGAVLAAGIVPQVVLLAGGGVLADRLGRRRVMLAADCLRGLAQAALAVALVARPPLWLFITLSAARGAGDAAFTPGLTGLTRELVPAAELGNANAMLGVAQSAAGVAGPAVAGVLAAVTGPALVIGLDAVSYGVSVLTLWRLPPGAPARRAPCSARGLLGDLAEGWAEFRSRPWLLAGALQFALFNLLTWGPFLLLGPVLSVRRPGGAAAWGTIMACYGAGSVLGGLLALGRRPRRPAAAATVATFGYAVPPALLAVSAPAAVVAAGALVAGACSALCAAFGTTAVQQQVPPWALARVSALEMVIAFAFGPLAFAATGPVASVAGIRPVLGFGAAWSVASTAVVLCLPSVWAVRWRDTASEAGGETPREPM